MGNTSLTNKHLRLYCIAIDSSKMTFIASAPEIYSCLTSLITTSVAMDHMWWLCDYESLLQEVAMTAKGIDRGSLDNVSDDWRAATTARTSQMQLQANVCARPFSLLSNCDGC